MVAIQDLCSSRFLKAKLRMVIGGAPIKAVAGSSGIVVRGTVVPSRGSSRVGMQGVGIAIPGTGIAVWGCYSARTASHGRAGGERPAVDGPGEQKAI